MDAALLQVAQAKEGVPKHEPWLDVPQHEARHVDAWVHVPRPQQPDHHVTDKDMQLISRKRRWQQ